MDIDDLIEEKVEKIVNEKIEDAVANIAKQEVENYVEANKDTIGDSHSFRKQIYNIIDHYLPTEIGNRLRCGIYDNTLVKKVFDECFEDELKKQIKSEIRTQCREMCRKEIREYFELALEKIKDNEKFIRYKLED